MNRATVAVVMVIAIGWVGTTLGGIDGVTTVCLLVAWLLPRLDAPWAVSIGWLVGLTALAVGAVLPATAAMGGAAVVALILLGFRRPRSDLAQAVLVGTFLMAALALAGLVLRLSMMPHPLLAMVILWPLAMRLAHEPRRLPLRWAMAPAIPMTLVVLALAVTGKEITTRERRMTQLATPASGGPPISDDAIRGELHVDPWMSAVWARLGWREFAEGNWDDARATFERGYLVRPTRKSPCAQGLALTTMNLGRWRDLARLMTSGHAPLTPPPAEGVVPVAVELWRRNDVALARQVLQPWVGSSPRVRELAGWLAGEEGDDSTAVELLAPEVSPGSAGETIYRYAVAQGRLGRHDDAVALLRAGAAAHPRHLRLARDAGYPPPPLPMRRVGRGVLMGNSVRLLAWECTPDPVRAGDTLTITIAWEPSKPLPALQVILHLDLGAPARWRKVADFWPDGRRGATAHWPVGEVAMVTTRVAVPEDAPAGRYTVYSGMWIPGERESRLLPGPADAHRVPRGELRFPLGDVVIRSQARGD